MNPHTHTRKIHISTITGQIQHWFCQKFYKTPHFEQLRKCNTDVLWYGVIIDGLRLQIDHMWYIFRVKHILIIHIFCLKLSIKFKNYQETFNVTRYRAI